MTSTILKRVPAPLAADIPPTREQRQQIEQMVQTWVATQALPERLDLRQLRIIAEQLLQELGHCPCYRDYTCVLLNNEIWRSHVARVPFAKRLLLLPKCLRHEEACEAPFDRLGLICQGCNRCSIHPLQQHAEELGYAVLVAEGSAVALEIIRSRGIEAVIGVSCLSVLERAFDHLQMAGMPGLAIPLLSNSCRNSRVDLEQVWDVVHLSDEGHGGGQRVDLTQLRQRLLPTFTRSGIDALLGPAAGSGEQAARDVLALGGKRWRPLLTAASALTLLGDPNPEIDESIRRLALAVECFHKASLIHDDLEDDDQTRDGHPCLHTVVGEASAINGGDYLLGEGYRLIAQCGHQRLPDMLRLATDCHLRLCRGQGWELDWRREGTVPTSTQVLDMFRFKTSPAFTFGLGLGAYLGGLDAKTVATIETYGDHLGIAYQIRDDRQDLVQGQAGGDLRPDRPSLAMSLLRERCNPSQRQAVDAWLHLGGPIAAVLSLLEEYAIVQEMGLLEAEHRHAARDAVLGIPSLELRNLLLRLVARIFDDVCLDAWSCGSMA